MNFKNIKKVLSCLVLALVALTLVGCGGGKETEKIYTYNDYTSVSPSNWNELTYQDSNDTQIMSYIGSSFFTYDFKFDAQGNILPGEFVMQYSAATALEDVTAEYVGDQWGIPADAKNRAYKITLREDLKWDDGTAIKAEDFVYTMKEQLNPAFRNYRADSFYLGATIIANAAGYAKQGMSGMFDSTNVYTEYSTEIDEKLIFSIGNEQAGKSYINAWATKQLGKSAAVSLSNAVYVLNYYGAGLTEATVAEMEGKTFAEIKANEAWKAQWDLMIGFWQTEPNEELHFFIAEYTYPEVAWDKVGIFVGETEYEIILVLEKALPLLKEDGSLSYQAAYNMSSLPLVKKSLYEQCKIEPDSATSLWTTNYNTSVETTASWGPYKLETFQSGKEYTLVRNEYWYGYNDPLYEGQYQTDRIVCKTVEEYETAFNMFLKGEIDGVGIDVTKADDYKQSEQAYYTPDDFVASLQLQSDKAQLEARQEEGKNKTLLAYTDFRKALSLSINRADFAVKTTTSSLAGFGLFNSMHYYDVENGGVYRNTDEAKQVLCDIYGVDASQFDSLDEAVDSITGYDLDLARELLESAYQEALANEDIKETDVVELTFGTSVINDVVTRRHDYIKNAWKELAVGTSLEGRITFSDDAELGDAWADDFRKGLYDVCMGGWSGAAWDPGYFLLAYLSPDYMYSVAWDTSSVQMTFKLEGVMEEEETMSLMDWYNCLNGATGAKYDFSATELEQEQRLPLIAALEAEVLKVYYSVPLYNSFAASLISYKVDYITYEYNTFMGYGGIRYMTYNFDDAAWEAEVAKQGNELNYK